MTKAKHTPGPMTQGASNAGKTCVWLGGATEPPHEMGPDTKWIDCNTEANARLIAAAPDLLAALIAITTTRCDGMDITPINDAWDMATAAIAKATTHNQPITNP